MCEIAGLRHRAASDSIPPHLLPVPPIQLLSCHVLRPGLARSHQERRGDGLPLSPHALEGLPAVRSILWAIYSMGNLWAIYGQSMGNLWAIYGQSMGNLWAIKVISGDQGQSEVIVGNQWLSEAFVLRARGAAATNAIK